MNSGEFRVANRKQRCNRPSFSFTPRFAFEDGEPIPWPPSSIRATQRLAFAEQPTSVP
jgi:hypothetical protein